MDFLMQEGHANSGVSAADLRHGFKDRIVRSTLELLPDGILVVDQGGLIHFINTAAQSLLNCSPPAGRTLSLKNLEEGGLIDYSGMLEAVSHGHRYNAVEVTGDGRNLLISARPVFAGDSTLVFSLVVVRSLDTINRHIGNSGQNQFVLLTDRDAPAADNSRICMSRKGEVLVEQAARAARMGIRVLLRGESGAGKTEVARHVHNLTLGPSRPFVHVNCASIPETLFESEMFGYAAGSFTGALNRGKKGYVEAAEGGTLFLDEVGEVPLHCQAKLLKFLEDGTVQRVGATGGRRVSIQFFSATNRDLLEMVKEREFRKDLYYRLSSLTLEIPPLRQTREIIPPLIEIFTAKLNRRREYPFKVSPECLRRLENYDYPGNIREMQNIIEHLAIVCDDVAQDWHLPPNVLRYSAPDEPGEIVPPPLADGETRVMDDGDGFFLPKAGTGFPRMSLKEEVRKYEAFLLREAIRSLGSKRKVAEMLGVDIATIVRKTRPGRE